MRYELSEADCKAIKVVIKNDWGEQRTVYFVRVKNHIIGISKECVAFASDVTEVLNFFDEDECMDIDIDPFMEMDIAEDVIKELRRRDEK